MKYSLDNYFSFINKTVYATVSLKILTKFITKGEGTKITRKIVLSVNSVKVGFPRKDSHEWTQLINLSKPATFCH